MEYIETIKIENGSIKNIEYHYDRMKSTIGRIIEPKCVIPDEFRTGVVKYRILYNEDEIIEETFAKYITPSITTLKLIEADIDYHFKYRDRDAINNLMKQRNGCDDILITHNGIVTDTSFCNVVFQNRDGLFTPDTPLLKGTKRQYLINNGIISERRIAVSDITLYDKLFLINAMIDNEELPIEIYNLK